MLDEDALQRLHLELDKPLSTEQTPEQLERERRRRIAIENEAALGGAAGIVTKARETA